jgi:arylformamidase
VPADWIDVTVPIHAGMVVYEGDPPVRVTDAAALERGDPANVVRLELGSHTGTHVDAPRHFVPGGETVDRLPPAALLGAARIVGCPPGPIDRATVTAALGATPEPGPARLIFKTGNSELWARDRFSRDYQALTLDGARALVDAGVRLVGIDYLSIEAFGPEHPVHRCLLGAGIVVLEGLDLRGVPPGAYELCCLPLRIRDGDGAPARALVRPL